MQEHKNFWDKNAGRYDRFMRKDGAAYEKMYALIRPVVKAKTVLELASGTGLIAKHIVNAAAHIEPVRASVPPLSGVFQQSIARRAKRLTPCPMHAPAIPAHHEGNGFDLLFLVQAPISFLFYMQLVTSNRLPEEKAGRLYAVCLLSDAKASSRARLTAPERARCRPVPSARC